GWRARAEGVADRHRIDVGRTDKGEPRQGGNPKNLICGIAKAVPSVSHFMSLRAGDLTPPGTPAGVAHGMKPPRYLQPGDVVEMGITKLGAQKNRVVAGDRRPT